MSKKYKPYASIYVGKKTDEEKGISFGSCYFANEITGNFYNDRKEVVNVDDLRDILSPKEYHRYEETRVL